MLHSRTTPEDAQSLMRLIKSRSSSSLKENVTISGDGGIGGLGFNSGNPATNQTEIERYIAVNTQNSDQVNKEVSGKLNTTQNPLSKMIGFKAYNPEKVTREKSLTYWDYDENGNPLLIDAIKRRAK
jgi:hypothetical protein